jgi:hypothetical protein
MIEAKLFGTFIRIYSLLKSERLSAKIKQNLHKALIRTVITYAWPGLGISGRHLPLKTRFCAPLGIFQGAHRSAICTQLLTFPICTII